METKEVAKVGCCTQECGGCVLGALKRSILENGSDTKINHALHGIRSKFKSSMRRNANGYPMSFSDRIERIDSAEETASQCRHPEVRQIATYDLQMMRTMLGNVQLGSCG